MVNKNSAKLLRIAFIIGAAVDALAILPMLIPLMSRLLWGFEGTQADYYFAMSMGASLMFGWTILLVWAAFRPLERRHIALFTVFVIVGIAAAEVFAVADNILSFGNALPSFVMQGVLTALFMAAYFISRRDIETK